MYVRTSGIPSNISLSMCRKAAKFYAKTLLGERLSNNIKVKIKFNDKSLGEDLYGFCDWHCDKPKPRNFIISIDPKLSKKMILLVLAHEMVHVKQYARGELKDLMRTNMVKYMGKLYDDEKISYWSHPWEKEARKLEKKLYTEFRKSLKS
jgi:hypothetical protein